MPFKDFISIWLLNGVFFFESAIKNCLLSMYTDKFTLKRLRTLADLDRLKNNINAIETVYLATINKEMNQIVIMHEGRFSRKQFARKLAYLGYPEHSPAIPFSNRVKFYANSVLKQVNERLLFLNLFA